MKERGLEIILAQLKTKPPATTGGKPELAAFSKEEERAFRREHHHIFITLQSNGVIAMGPMRRLQSGFVASREEVIEIGQPCSDQEFLDALNQVFSMF